MRTCITCAHPMRTSIQRAADAPGTRRHTARGLCQRCYREAAARDAIPEFEPIRHFWDDLVDDVEVLLARTDPLAVAANLGMTPNGIAQAAHRHGRPDLARKFWAAANRARRQARRELA